MSHPMFTVKHGVGGTINDLLSDDVRCDVLINFIYAYVGKNELSDGTI